MLTVITQKNFLKQDNSDCIANMVKTATIIDTQTEIVQRNHSQDKD